ncbi:MAG: hypothetical protein R2823_09450 [Acidimicrobiia bacterium]
MRGSRMMVGIIVLSVAMSACSGSDDATGDGPSDGAGGDLPDNCSLITEEEATTLAGYDLEVGEDSFLGCGFIPPGANVADIVVATAVRSGGAAAVAADAYPNATEVIPVSVGADTVAVTSPSGESIAAILTTDGDRVVELGIIFLLIDPTESSRIDDAAELAVTALGRWGG